MHLVVENGNAFLSINGCQTALIMAKAKLQVLQKQKKGQYFVIIRWVRLLEPQYSMFSR
jgi:hypothetical protein